MGTCVDAWPVRLQQSAALGRYLVAARDVDVGDTIIREKPAVTWPAEGDVDTVLTEACERHGFQMQGCVRVLAEYSSLGDCEKEVIAGLSVPEFDPASQSMVRARNVARDVAQSDLLGGMGESDVLALILAVKSNCHRHALQGPQGALGGVCAVASKLSHSCRPALCCYLSGEEGLRFAALRSVPEGGELCFSYRGDGDWLSQSTKRRKEDLQRCFYFDCACARCAEPDRCRQAPCECGLFSVAQPDGWLYECGRSDAPCAEWLATESSAEEAVDGLDGDRVSLVRRYTALRSALLAAAPLGSKHWAVAALYRMLQEYFLALLNGPPPPPLVVRGGQGWAEVNRRLLSKLGVSWGSLKLSAWRSFGLDGECPLTFAHAQIDIVQAAGGGPHDNDVRETLEHLHASAAPVLRSVYQADAAAAAPASVADCAPAKCSRTEVPPPTADELMREWEGSVAGRVLAKMGVL